MIIYLVYLVLFFLLAVSIGIMFSQIYINFIQPGAIYYPSKIKAVEDMMKLAKIGKKDVVVDLGSGDGIILIAAAKRGARAIGYEIDPLLVRRSRKAIKDAGLDDRATVIWKSFWKVDLKGVNVIAVYLFPHLMKRLWKLVEKKADHPIRMVCNDYAVPGVKPDKQEGKIYLYEFGKK